MSKKKKNMEKQKKKTRRKTKNVILVFLTQRTQFGDNSWIILRNVFG